MLAERCCAKNAISVSEGRFGRILVYAADDSAYYFYKAHGLIEYPNSPTTLILLTSKL